VCVVSLPITARGVTTSYERYKDATTRRPQIMGVICGGAGKGAPAPPPRIDDMFGQEVSSKTKVG